MPQTRKANRALKFRGAQTRMLKMLQGPEFAAREDAQTTLPALKQLLEINRLGFLTEDSQQGIIKANIHERAYIVGIMKEADAELFVKNMSLFTDKVCMIISVIDKYDSTTYDKIPLTYTTNYNKIGKYNIDTAMTAIYPQEQWDFVRKQGFNIAKSEKVVPVFCYDVKWGRKATIADGLFTSVIKVLSHTKTNFTTAADRERIQAELRKKYANTNQ